MADPAVPPTSGDPFLSSQFDPQLAESSAQQITSASLTNYGAAPNPQAVYEAISTGSTPQIVGAISSGDPSYRSLLSASHAGQPLAQSYGSIPSGIKDPNQSVISFDWSKYWGQDNHAQLEDDKNKNWRDFGYAPQFNVGWMQGVETKSTPDQIQKWQHLLQSRGFLGQDYQVGGNWDKDTQAAFEGFMIQRAMAPALYAKNSGEQAQARMFLNMMGVDVTQLDSQMGRDPTFSTQVAKAWMFTDGPGAQVGTKDSLKDFADQFGEENLPTSYQALEHESLGESVRNGLDSLPLIGDIPVLGGAWHALTNVATGNLDFSHLTDDPRKVKETQVEQGLTEDDKKILDPALQQAKDSQGFLGFMDDYDHARTKFFLGLLTSFSEGIHTGKWGNPFDPLSGANMWADAHKDNFAAGLWGDQWAHDNPILAGVWNMTVNTVDDPITYLPFVGEAEIFQRMRGVRTMGKLIGNKGEAQALFAKKSFDGVRYTANRSYLQGMRDLVAKKGTAAGGDLNMGHMASAFGITSTDQLKLMNKVLDPATGADDAWHIFQYGEGENGMGFGHMLNSHKGLYNMAANFRNLSKIKSEKQFTKIRAVGALEEHPVHDIRTDPVSTGKHLANAADAIGVNAGAEIDAYMKAVLDNANDALPAFQKAQQKITQGFLDKAAEKGITEAEVNGFIAKIDASRSFAKSAGAVAGRASLYAPAPEARTTADAVEKSIGAETGGGKATQAINKRLDQTRTKLSSLGPDATPEERQALEDQAKGLSSQGERGVPMLETQLGDMATMPYSIAEMVAILNPILRKSERIQAGLHVDAMMSTWKRLTIGRLSSAFRITLGDDTIRPVVQLIGMGHPLAAADLLFKSILKSAGLIVPGARKRLQGNVAEGIQTLVDAGHPIGGMLQEAHKFFQDATNHIFQPFVPGQAGYHSALMHTINHHWGQSQLVQTWLKAEAKKVGSGRDALKKLVANTDDPELKAWGQVQGIDLSPNRMNYVLDNAHDYFGGLFRDPTLAAMVRDGKVDAKKLAGMIKDPTKRELLPTISSRSDSGFAKNVVQSLLNKYPNYIFDHVTGPMVNQARYMGYKKLNAKIEKSIRDFYKDQPGREGEAWDKAVADEAHNRTLHWMQDNTYQGGRSVMGNSLRNVFPFYGATANMDRFWMRQTMATPALGHVVAEVAANTDKGQRNPQNDPVGFEGILAHMGFGAGEGLTFNPANMFFLTADGVGSFVPGTGPVFAPLWNVISGNATAATILQDIPGLGSQIDYNTGKAKPMFPWMANLVTGLGMAVTGQNVSVPFLGEGEDAINRAVDEKVKQRERNGETVTPDDLDSIRREVGRDFALKGGLQFAVPMSPNVVDAQGKQLTTDLDAWRNTTTGPEKDAIIAQHLGIDPTMLAEAIASGSVSELIANDPQNSAAAMLYLDHRVDPTQRDAIANLAPWVVSAATSMYTTTAGQPMNLQQWQVLRARGDVQLNNPDTYLQKIGNERDINTAWLEYDDLKNIEFQVAQENGWATTDQAYKDWKAANFDPKVIELEAAHPAWAKVFGSQQRTDAPGLYQATRPLRTVSTWEVIPQHSDFENQKSILWRNAILYRDQAAAEIQAIKASRGSRTAQDQVMETLQQQLQQLAAHDPNFAAELAQTRFSSWADVVELEAIENKANQSG